MSVCLACSKPLSKDQKKFCSNKCQSSYQYLTYISLWKDNRATGIRGVNAKNISKYLERYLHEKFKGKCCLCGWSKRNPVTLKVPLEIDHIDGNSENNLEENLRLICPNCHSLSSNFRNLNRGNGRTWRKAKYVKNQIKEVMV